MAFMKKDINFGLLFIIIILAVAIACIGIYYNQNYNSLSTEYHTQVDSLQKVTNDLLLHKSILNQTAADLRVKEEDESELNQKYNQLRSGKEQADRENSELKAELADKNSQLVEKTNKILALNSDIAEQKTQIAKLTNEVDVYTAQVNSLKKHLELTCGGSTVYCD